MIFALLSSLLPIALLVLLAIFARKKVFQKFIGNFYSILIEIVLWLIPFAGLIFCQMIPGLRYGVNRLLGMFLGLIGGIILDIILFAPLVMLLNIRESLKNMEELMKKSS